MHAGVQKTPVIHTHVVEGLNSTNKQNAPTRELMYTHTRVYNMYKHTYTQTHIYTDTYISTCTYTRIHAHTYTYACMRTSIHRQKFSATTPQRVKQYHRRTYASIYICMHIHTYMHIHICAQPAANVSTMCTLMSKEHLYNAYNCMPWCSEHLFRQHSLQKNAHIYIHTDICIRIHIHKSTHAHL